MVCRRKIGCFQLSDGLERNIGKDYANGVIKVDSCVSLCSVVLCAILVCILTSTLLSLF